MSSSPYAKDIQNILASLNQPDDEPQSLPDEEPTNTLYVYKTEQGGVLLSPTRIEGDEEDPQPETIIDSQDEPQPAKREPPHFLYFILILCLFVVLDVANSQLIAFMTPTVNVTLQPTVKTITLHSTAQLGKVLSPITLTESQTVTTTGHGHQDARAATGSLAFYNTAFTSQTVDAGTVITGADGVKIVTSETVSLPLDNPPVNGQALVLAHALDPGVSGNIAALDINGIFSSALYVKNLVPFINGQDTRDFQIVTKADRDTAAAALQAKVTASMNAALQGQLMPGQELQTMPCTPIYHG